MNAYNQRLKEIQRELIVYRKERKKSYKLGEIFEIQQHIDRLEKEEREILKRSGVEL